jgi:2-keto-4-pentenoate hydratase/2-oxohepta-3-ene-1,7-dioic acid hydratase (catechol pathway)
MPNGLVADCNYGYAAYLKSTGFSKPQQMADVLVPPRMIGLIESGREGLDAMKQTLAFLEANPSVEGPEAEQIFYRQDEIHFKAPVPDPEKIFCTAINNKFEFERCTKPEGEDHVLYFNKVNTCLCGAYDPVEIPDIGVVGTEVEMVFVIAKEGKFVPKEKARDFVFGFTVHNDLTAFTLRINREWIICNNGEGNSEKVTYPGRYKCFDTFGPMGPWLVTVDELPIDEAFNQVMQASISGQMMQDGSTSEMKFRVDELIPYFSEAHTLKPGDLVSTGTVISYVGAEFDNIDLRASAGKVLESTIEKIGTMRNPIKAI